MANPEHLRILKQGVEAWNKWRGDSSDTLHVPDLRDADLPGFALDGANLHGAELSGADLKGASLREANLGRAWLFMARLGGTDLRGSNLARANFNGADLSDANLSGVHASGTIFRRTVLVNTLFTEAFLSETIFAFTSLNAAKDLETCNHMGPSALDHHTLIASGRLPEVFLRGCGLSDDFIKFLPSFRNQPIQFYSAFISYHHEDKPFARRLHDGLQGRGIRCWLDEHQIKAGDKIHPAVDEGIRLWDKVLLCCSEAALASWWVNQEVEKAVAKEEQLSTERGKDVLAIIPLNLDGYMFRKEWNDWKKRVLTTRAAPDFSGWDRDNSKFEAQLEKVIQALRADTGARVPPPKPLL